MLTIQNHFKDTKRILIHNPSFIGDAVLTTPLINAVKTLLPDARLTFCVRPESAPLFKNLGFDLLIFDKRGKQKGIRGFIRFVSALRQKRFDLVISPHKSFRTSLALLFSGIPVKIGFSQSSGAFVYSRTVPRQMSLHEAERNLSLLMPITEAYTLAGAKQTGGKGVTYLDGHYAEISGKLMRISSEGAPLVGISAGSAWPTKRWPVERYARLAQKLHEDGFAIAIFGGPGDEEVNNRLKSMLRFEYFDYANKVHFSKIPALIHNMDLLISNDSAPVHIAVSQNTPVVAIFGPTVPAQGFAPYGGKNIVCENEGLYCRPCSLHGGRRCPEKHFRCMQEISADMVYEAAVGILESAPE